MKQRFTNEINILMKVLESSTANKKYNASWRTRTRKQPKLRFWAASNKNWLLMCIHKLKNRKQSNKFITPVRKYYTIEPSKYTNEGNSKKIPQVSCFSPPHIFSISFIINPIFTIYWNSWHIHNHVYIYILVSPNLNYSLGIQWNQI